MARRKMRDVDRRSGTERPLPVDRDPGPWLFPFDRARHERARDLLGTDTAARYLQVATTARIIDDATREYERAERDGGHDSWFAVPPGSAVADALCKLVDVQERHVTLLTGESGHDTLTLAELAVAHRRQLARCDAARHRPLLGLSLVLLTHQMQAAGRFAEAVATGQEAIDILSRHCEVVPDGDLRPALVLAFDVSLMTCLAKGRRVDAFDDLVKATELLDEIWRDRPEFAPDRDAHLRVLSRAIAGQQLDRELSSALADVPSGSDVTLEARSCQSAARGLTDADTDPETSAATGISARSHADELYDDAQHLAASDGDGPAAVIAAGAAVAAYRRMLGELPAERWHRTLRRLSRALWRHAIILNELLGRPRDAMGPGRESLSLAREMLRATESTDELDELISELGVTLLDLSHIAFAADLVGEHDQLAEEARRITLHSVGAAAMHALGAALQSRAADACETTAALAARGRDMTATVAAGVHTSGRAVAVRRSLVDSGSDVDGEQMRRWELANSLLAHGHLRGLSGDGQGGAQAIVDAHAAVATVPGHAAHAMRDTTRAALLAACAANPDITPSSDWPL